MRDTSEVRRQRSEVRSQKSEVRSQRFVTLFWPLTSDHCLRLMGLWPLPGRVVIQGEQLLNTFRPAAAAIVQDFKRLANPVQARIIAHTGSSRTPTDAIE